MASLLDRIIAAELKESVIDVPQWGASIGIREFTADQRMKFAEQAQKNASRALVRSVIDCTFDPETKKPLFEPAHQDLLLEKSGAAIGVISDAIIELSGMSAKSAETLEKN
jgi:hypothetical protein